MPRRLLLAACLLLLPTLGSWAQASDQAADHDALRKLKVDIAQALSKQDFDDARKVLHDPFMVTINTQNSFTGLPELKQYYQRLFTQNQGYARMMKSVTIQPEADELSQIHTGTFAITRGFTKEHYELADGRNFNLKGRWTATSLKQPDGSWKLLTVHMGVNFLDNPVIHAVEKSVYWVSAIAAGIGLLSGIILSWLLFRPRRAA